MTTPAGWYPDPDYPTMQRRWDGAQWTQERVPAPQESVAPQPRAGNRAAGWLVVVLLLVGAGALIWFIVAGVTGGPRSGDAAKEDAFIAAAQREVVAAGGVWVPEMEAIFLAYGKTVCATFVAGVPRADSISVAQASVAQSISDPSLAAYAPVYSNLIQQASDVLCPE